MTGSIASQILAARYPYNGEKNLEDVYRRVADALGETDNEKKTFFEEMHSLRFIPNSSTLMNAGTENGQPAACFTLPVGDSLPEIFDALKWGPLIHQSSGGTGYNFSTIRPKASPVPKTDGTASGPVSFMQIFNQATEIIRQGDRRRGRTLSSSMQTTPTSLPSSAPKRGRGILQTSASR